MHTIITGGSSGIGLEIASLLIRRGHRVSIIARSLERLEHATAAFGLGDDQRLGSFLAQSGDVCDAPSINDAIHSCAAHFGPVDQLITSAGIVAPNLFAEQAASDFEGQIQTNLIGSANAVRAVYPGMLKRGSGRICLVSSGAGLLGVPGYSGYCASKFGLRGFAEALYLEAKPYGVNVSICFPPDTDTPQYRAEMRDRPHAAREFLGDASPMPAQEVAKRILKGMERGVHFIDLTPGTASIRIFGSFITPVLTALYFRKNAVRNSVDHIKKNQNST